MIILTPLRKFKFPITADSITPEIFKNKTCAEIAALKVWEGNKQKKLSEIFKVENVKAESPTITIKGDVNQVRRIGSKMKGGEIVIYGNAGMHLGERMESGKITIYGNVGGWAGSAIKGGTIEIQGNTGDYLGAPYRGNNQGMNGGKIIVYGNVGNEAGAYMRNGIINIHGNAGQFLGLRMRNGTIYVEKDVEARIGACMIGGKIVVGGFLESVLPTFIVDSIKPKVKVGENHVIAEPFYLLLGDRAENGNGKLYVSKQKNPSLSWYDKFL